MLALLEERVEAQPDIVVDTDFTLLHLGLGDRDLALDYLERALEQRMGTMIFIATFPPWRELHSDPRFIALLERIGVPGFESAESVSRPG